MRLFMIANIMGFGCITAPFSDCGNHALQETLDFMNRNTHGPHSTPPRNVLQETEVAWLWNPWPCACPAMYYSLQSIECLSLCLMVVIKFGSE